MTREEAAPYLELGMRHLPEGDSEERVRLLMAQGAWSWGFGEAVMEPAAVASDRAAAEEAVAMARRLGNAHLLSGALDTLGATGSLLSGYRGVLEPQWERLELVPQLEDAAEITDIYGVTAWGLAHLGNFREAEELGLRGLEVTERTGIVNYVPGAFAGVAQFRMADWSGFWETFHRVDGALDPERTLRYHAHRIYGVAAYVLEVTGDPEGADRIIARLDRSQADLGLVGVSGARSWIVGVLARRGEFAAARSRLAVVDPVREIQNRDLTHEAWADVIAAEGTWAEAAEIVRAARHWAEESGLRFLPAVADRLEGQAELATGLAERGATALQRARVTFIELEAAWDRARTELPLSRALQAIGRGQEAAEAARAALATFQEVGAVAEIAEAESILAEARA